MGRTESTEEYNPNTEQSFQVRQTCIGTGTTQATYRLLTDINSVLLIMVKSPRLTTGGNVSRVLRNLSNCKENTEIGDSVHCDYTGICAWDNDCLTRFYD